jgi:hypothetical protein
MPFSLHPFRRFPVQCSVTYNAGPFLKLLLAYFSGFWSLITLLMLGSGPVYAELVRVSGDNQGKMAAYVDLSTIRRKAGVVEMWELWDFKDRQASASGSFLSSKTQRGYDCAGKRRRRLAGSWFSGHMEKGKLLYSDSHKSEWVPVEPDSMHQTLWKFACSKK